MSIIITILAIIVISVAIINNKSKSNNISTTVTNVNEEVEEKDKVKTDLLQEENNKKLEELKGKFSGLIFPDMNEDLKKQYIDKVEKFNTSIENEDLENATKYFKELEEIKSQADVDLAKLEEEKNEENIISEDKPENEGESNIETNNQGEISYESQNNNISNETKVEEKKVEETKPKNNKLSIASTKAAQSSNQLITVVSNGGTGAELTL